MAIIVDAKTPIRDSSETTSDTQHVIYGPPPEYVAEEGSPHSPNNDPPEIPPPTDKQTISSETQPTNHDRWWRRWLRSPIALSLIFLGCAVIATGIALAVHFTVGRGNQQPNYPEPQPMPYGPYGNNLTGADAFGPWSSSVKTFTFPRNTAHMEFLSLQGLVDGFTQVGIGSPNQTDIEADVNIQWKAQMLTSPPVVNSYYDPTNSSISITCPPSYSNDSAFLPNVFIYANITVRLPPNYTYGSMDLRSIATSPHCWTTSIADLANAGIVFDKVLLQSGSGPLISQNLIARHFTAYSEYGNIYGAVEATDSYNVTARHGVNSLVNLDISTGNYFSSMIPRSWIPVPRQAFRC